MFERLSKGLFGKRACLGFISWNMMVNAMAMDLPLVEANETLVGGQEYTALQGTVSPELSECVNSILELIVEEAMGDKVYVSPDESLEILTDASTPKQRQRVDSQKRSTSLNRVSIYSSPKQPRARRTSSEIPPPRVRRISSGNLHPITRVISQEKLILQVITDDISFLG